MTLRVAGPRSVHYRPPLLPSMGGQFPFPCPLTCRNAGSSVGCGLPNIHSQNGGSTLGKEYSEPPTRPDDAQRGRLVRPLYLICWLSYCRKSSVTYVSPLA